MTYNELQQRLSDLIAFQCVLVSLRGVSSDASEEMLWQTLLAALAEQYVLHRLWYGRYADGRLRPVVSVPVGGCGLDDLPAEIEESSPILASADLDLPVSVEGPVEGRLLFHAGGAVPSERAEQMRILVSEATTMLAQQRSRLRQAEALRAAERAQAFLASIVESSADAIIGTNLDGTILSWNQGAEALYGYTETEMIGNMASALAPPELSEETQQLLNQVERGVRVSPFETVRRRKDGARADVSLAVSPIRDAAGSVIGAAGIARDISSQKLAAQVLAETEVRYRELFEESHDLVFTHDVEGNFTSLNRAGQQVCGYCLEEILKMNARDLLTPESAELVRGWIDRYHPNEPHGTREVGVLAKDGRTLILEVSISTLYREGRPVGVLGIARDVSARKRAEEALLKAKEGAVAGSRAKSEFLANMSHEIRTPMNGIIGLTNLTLETKLTSEQREYLGMVRYSAGSLLGIINDILDFSKIEAGKFDLELVAFNLRENLQATTKAFALRAEEKGLKLACEVSAVIPERIVGDPARLRQIVVNLLGNAIKFTSLGEVTLQVESEFCDDEYVLVHFVVIDTGVGIPQAKHKVIFEAFSQADGATTRKFGGTGLGLAISTHLVEKMGGRIWVESAEGLGSRFHFTARLGRVKSAELPRPPEESSPAVVTKPIRQSVLRGAMLRATGGQSRDIEASQLAIPRIPEARNRLRILVAEDNPVNRTLAVRLLERQGHKVSTAGNGLEALTEMEKQDFELVLMDVQMPEMDGVEATKAIRNREKQTRSHVRIVAVTAHAMAADREICLAAGMDGYISKPINKEELLSTIEKLTNGKAEMDLSVSSCETATICE
jgi:PAS domain S-box-containing protein